MAMTYREQFGVMNRRELERRVGSDHTLAAVALRSPRSEPFVSIVSVPL
jgi:hypothetical protein